jgi:hypothetical protein
LAVHRPHQGGTDGARVALAPGFGQRGHTQDLKRGEAQAVGAGRRDDLPAVLQNVPQRVHDGPSDLVLGDGRVIRGTRDVPPEPRDRRAKALKG